MGEKLAGRRGESGVRGAYGLTANYRTGFFLLITAKTLCAEILPGGERVSKVSARAMKGRCTRLG